MWIQVRFPLMNIVLEISFPINGSLIWWANVIGCQWNHMSLGKLSILQMGQMIRVKSTVINWESFRGRGPDLLLESSSRFFKSLKSIQAKRTRTRYIGKGSLDKVSFQAVASIQSMLNGKDSVTMIRLSRPSIRPISLECLTQHLFHSFLRVSKTILRLDSCK